MHISDKTYDILNDISHLYAPFMAMLMAILAICLQSQTMAVVTAVFTAVDGFVGVAIKYFKAKYEKEKQNG